MEKKTAPHEYGFAGIVVLVVLFLVILGLGGFMYIQNAYQRIGTDPETLPRSTQTPEPTTAPLVELDTSKWKVYEDKKNLFSFKYPETMTLADYKEGTNSGVELDIKEKTLIEDKTDETTAPTTLFRVTVLKNEAKSADEYILGMINAEKAADNSGESKYSEIYSRFLGGKEGYQYVVRRDGSTRKVVVLGLNNGSLLKVEGMESQEAASFFNIDSVLDSFRFLVLGASR